MPVVMRPEPVCDCHLCSDRSTITICGDEAHRQLRMDYSEHELVRFGTPDEEEEVTGQRTLFDY